jgi:RimJ/RimL family protein N-acetyltransferase
MLDTNKQYILENERVRLEPLQLSHFESLLPYSLKEPELWIYSLTPGNGAKNLNAYITEAIQQTSNGTTYAFAVVDKESNIIVGSTRFYDIQPHHQTTQIGYTWYGKEFQGTGINKNCKLLMLDFAFGQLNVKRVEFRADANNKRSIAAMNSIGCTKEGVLRSNCSSPSGRRDSIVLSILQSEWNNSVRSELLRKT